MHAKARSAALVATSLLVMVTGVAGGVAQAAPAPAQHRDGPVVVVRGLNNPREISVLRGGSLLVAEAGRGGDAVCLPAGEGGGPTCLGPTGSVSWVFLPSVRHDTRPLRVITGLLSLAGPNGSQATGASGVSARSLRDIYIVMTGKPPAALPPELDTSLLGHLSHARLPGRPRPVADLQGYEVANDPDHQGPDSNPFSVLALPGRVLAADAAGNDIVQWKNGRLTTFAVLPNIQDGACAGRPNNAGTTGCDPVPTGLAVGRDGSIYVSGLGGFTLGAGRVWKLDGRTGQVQQVWGGLNPLTGIALGPDGSIYASQLFTAFGAAGPDFTTGKVTRIRPDGTRTDTPVPAPAGLAVVGHNLYVSAWSIAPETGLGVPGVDSSGQLWRLRV